MEPAVSLGEVSIRAWGRGTRLVGLQPHKRRPACDGTLVLSAGHACTCPVSSMPQQDTAKRKEPLAML